MDDQQLKALIKGEYGQAALQAKGGGSSCCGPTDSASTPSCPWRRRSAGRWKVHERVRADKTIEAVSHQQSALSLN